MVIKVANRIYQSVATNGVPPWLSAVACLIVYICLLPLLWPHYLMGFLGFVSIWFVFATMYIEWPLLGKVPVPPLTVIMSAVCIRAGIAPVLLAASGYSGDSFLDTWVEFGMDAQLLWISVAAILLVGVWTQRDPVKALAKKIESEGTSNTRLDCRGLSHHVIRSLCVVLSGYMVMYTASSLVSGAWDRQFDVYMEWASKSWRIDTPLTAFSRLRDIWFCLIPLFWWKLGRPYKFLVGSIGLVYVGSAILSGSRGLLFYPVLMSYCGLWVTSISKRFLCGIGICMATIFLIAAPVIYGIRDTAAFQGAKDWTGKVNAIGTTLTAPEPIIEKARWVGRDLYACHDPFLFTHNNEENLKQGWRGLHSLLYLWIPNSLMKNRPVIFDGHLIAKRLQGISEMEGRFWYPCISLPGDLYRRWSWQGIFLGGSLISIVFWGLCRLWYKSASYSKGTFRFLVLMLPVSYLQSIPLGTVQETAWGLLWELPKYLVTLFLIGWICDFTAKRWSN